MAAAEPARPNGTRDDEFPPRGSGAPGRPEMLPAETWGHPWELGESWTWSAGKVLLGHWDGRLLGRDDDRHVVTVAGSRAGKSSTVLIPNLLRYPGSVIVLDPKGELARATAKRRQEMGQSVFVLDPFGESGFPSASHNPLDELKTAKPEHVAADAFQLADALIISNERDPHWTDAAKNLIRGIALHLLATDPGKANIEGLRDLLNANLKTLDALFTAMVESEAFDGITRNIGSAFLAKLSGSPRELQSILSTAQEQTTPLDDVRRITAHSDFRLADLKTGKMSLYLVLPGMRMGTHFRWLRLVVQQALAAMEQTPTTRGALPVWFVLEEFATLGYMRSLETAAGFMAGFGVKLWSVLQDLAQLKTHYPKSWETFLGNAGVIQAFGNVDLETTDYLSKRLGQTIVIETQDVRVSASGMAQGDSGRREHVRQGHLLAPNEITRHFSREANRQLILVPGRPPIYMSRLPAEKRE
jgi:type IV secretion system protein VirD4